MRNLPFRAISRHVSIYPGNGEGLHQLAVTYQVGAARQLRDTHRRQETEHRAKLGKSFQSVQGVLTIPPKRGRGMYSGGCAGFSSGVGHCCSSRSLTFERMTMRVRFHGPGWPLERHQQGRVQLWHVPLRRPLSRVLWVWEAPACKAYHPLVRQVFLTLLRESQPEKLAALRSLGFRLIEETHLDGLITGLEGLTENLPAALQIVHRLWTEVPLTQAALRPIIERLSQERRREWAYPSFRASAYLKQHLWGHTYAIGSTLSPDDIRTLSAEEMRHFYENVLQKSLRHLLVVAPTYPAALRPWLSWQGALSYALPVHNPAWGWHTEAHQEAQQASLRIAYPGLRRSNPRYPLFRLALTHLGGYFGSRLMGEIREKGGYTYGIYARPVETWTGAYFLVESELDKARASEAVQKTLDIITAWAEKPFASEEALAETRNYLIARLSPETPSEWVSTLANLLLHGYTPDWYIQQGERLSQLEISDYADWPVGRFGEPVGGVLVGGEVGVLV